MESEIEPVVIRSNNPRLPGKMLMPALQGPSHHFLKETLNSRKPLATIF